jgi:branched-chain amino acid transport system ATP-binding protein
VLEVNNIEVVYSDVILVLKGISLKVDEGKIVSLLGGNGAGKTTTLNAVVGALKYMDGEVTDGHITFFGERIDHMDPHKIIKKGISIVPEGRGIFSEFTVNENLLIGAYNRKRGKNIKAEFAQVFEYFPAIASRKNDIAGYLSGGEHQMLAIGRALLSSSKLMILDEPSLGLAPLLVEGIFDILRRINNEKGTSILLVEQNARLALEFSLYAYIMENGNIVIDGPSSILKENEDVKEFYLGIKEDESEKSYAEVKHYKRRKRWLS